MQVDYKFGSFQAHDFPGTGWVRLDPWPGYSTAGKGSDWLSGGWLIVECVCKTEEKGLEEEGDQDNGGYRCHKRAEAGEWHGHL